MARSHKHQLLAFPHKCRSGPTPASACFHSIVAVLRQGGPGEIAVRETAGDIDGEGHNERQAYRIKLSRWYRGAFAAVKHPIFWFLLYICRAMRGPLTHFFLFLQKASQNDNQGQSLFCLVTEKCQQIQAEYHRLLANADEIIGKALELSDCSSLAADDVEKLRLLGWKLLLQQYSAFHRRMIVPLNQQLELDS